MRAYLDLFLQFFMFYFIAFIKILMLCFQMLSVKCWFRNKCHTPLQHFKIWIRNLNVRSRGSYLNLGTLVLIPFSRIRELKKSWFHSLDFRTVNFDALFRTLALQVFIPQPRFSRRKLWFRSLDCSIVICSAEF